MYEVWQVPDIISSLGTLMAGAAACAGALVAGIGLSTWKKQLRWQVDHDLAKRALLSAYKFRDSLYSVRHPAMSEAEMKLSAEDREQIVAGGDRSAGVINAYANRWEKHADASRSLDALLLETDAVWGKDLRDMLAPLKDLERELHTFIFFHIAAHLRGDTELAKSYKEILNAKRDILYDLLDADKDEFRKDFESQLTVVESFLREKLGAKT